MHLFSLLIQVHCLLLKLSEAEDILDPQRRGSFHQSHFAVGKMTHYYSFFPPECSKWFKQKVIALSNSNDFWPYSLFVRAVLIWAHYFLLALKKSTKCHKRFFA